MSVGASPRTGTLNSRDIHHSQLTNMSSGSQVISYSPPLMPLSSLASPSYHQQYHAAQQQYHAAARPVLSSPPRQQSVSASPLQLSPRELSPVSVSVMSPTVPAITVNATSSDMRNRYTPSPGHAAGTDGVNYFCFSISVLFSILSQSVSVHQSVCLSHLQRH